MTDTMMTEAFAKAGKLSPRRRLERFAEIAMATESFEAARGLFLEALMSDAGAMRELMGDALTKRAGDYLHEMWNKQNSRPGGPRAGVTQSQNASSDSNGGGDGQPHLEAQTHAVIPAANSPTRRAAAKARMTSIMDTFAILDRNGERLPIGDIRLTSYDRLIRMTAKRSWSAHREHALLRLLKAETERRAVHYPEGTLTREIFDEAAMAALVETATQLALPKLEERTNA